MAFPATPANNQTYTSISGERYIFITDRWKKISIASGTNHEDLVTVDTATYSGGEQAQAATNLGLEERGPHLATMVTASGTHTFNVNTKYAVIYVQGAGGGGGTANASSITQSCSGGSGSGGVCAVKKIDVAADGVTSATITIGAGGTGTTWGTSTGDGGTEGGQTEYWDGVNYCSAFGGLGGYSGYDSTSHYIRQGRPGRRVGINGDFYHTDGCSSENGYGGGDNAVSVTTIRATSGTGGHSYFGSGGNGVTIAGSSSGSTNGAGGIGYGGGGSGGVATHGGGGAQGGTGGAGCVLIVEYR